MAYIWDIARQISENMNKNWINPNQKEIDRKNKDLTQNEYSMRNITARLMSNKQTLFQTAGNHSILTFLRTYRYIEPPRYVIRW